MRPPFVFVTCCLALLASACSTTTRAPDGSGGTGVAAPDATATVAVADIPACDAVERISAPAAWYREAPIYVANEQPTEELVDVDLSQPGAVAEPGDVHGDPALPPLFVLRPGSVIEPEVEYPYRFFVHCGIEWLGTFNDVTWRAELPGGSPGGVPPQWPVPGADQMIEVSIILHTDPEPMIQATANDHTVNYRPTADDPPGCD